MNSIWIIAKLSIGSWRKRDIVVTLIFGGMFALTVYMFFKAIDLSGSGNEMAETLATHFLGKFVDLPFYLFVGLIMTLFAIVLNTALISKDLRTRAAYLFLSKPMSVHQYVLGKFLSTFLQLFMFTGFIMVIGFGAYYFAFKRVTIEFLYFPFLLLPEIVFVSLVMAYLTIYFSKMISNFGIFLFYLICQGFHAIANEGFIKWEATDDIVANLKTFLIPQLGLLPTYGVSKWVGFFKDINPLIPVVSSTQLMIYSFIIYFLIIQKVKNYEY